MTGRLKGKIVTPAKRDEEEKMTVAELMHHNFDKIFIELDPVKREAMMRNAYTEDCVWIHPGGRLVGIAAINEAASEIRKAHPGVPLHGGWRYSHDAHCRDVPLGERTSWPTVPLYRYGRCGGTRRSRCYLLHLHRWWNSAGLVDGIRRSLGWKTWLTRSNAVRYLPDCCCQGALVRKVDHSAK